MLGHRFRDKLIFIFSLLLLMPFFFPLGAQEKSDRVNAQDILARLDETLNFGNGLTKGNLTLIQRSGQATSWRVNLFRDRSSLLFLFEKKGRGLEYKLLSLDEGDKIYLYNVVSSKLFRKTEEEKYENFLNSGFGYVDLSGYLYQANYDPLMSGEVKIGDESLLRVSLKPIITYSYNKLVLLVQKDTKKPVRIDFHDKDGVLWKTMNIKYGPVKLKTSSGVRREERVSRLEMLTLTTGNIGIWEIEEQDTTVVVDRVLFDVDNLGR